jgi:hypothetical protein
MSENADATTTTTTETTEGKEDVAGLKSALQAERDARKQAEKSSNDLAKQLKAIQDSGKSESEKLAARLEALEKDNAAKSKSIAERDARDEVKDAAKKAGAPDPDLIFRVLKSDLEYDTDGSVLNTKALIDDLKTTTPHLFKPTTGKADGGSGTGTKAATGGMNQWIRQAAGVDT